MTLRSLWTTLPGVALTAVLCGTALGCTTGTHPLDGDGTVEIESLTADPLFAKLSAEDTVWQEPYEMTVRLSISRSGKPEHGAYVDVHVTPAPSLTLTGTDDTCSYQDGVFRCVGNDEGKATFKVTAHTWSGTARIVVAWANNQTGLDVHIKPAGLPEGTTDFELLAEGSDNSESARIRPAYPFTSLCTLGGDEPSQWPSSTKPIRNSKLRVRAIPPTNLPLVVKNAPVQVSSDSTEAEFSTEQACTTATRSTRIVIRLNDEGESDAFYVCFSNVGGTLKVSAKSGEITSGPIRVFIVDPEPRLLEIKPLVPIAIMGTEADLWQVLAYGAANMLPIPLEVDFKSIGVPMSLAKATAKLSTDTNAPTTIRVTPLAVGTAAVRVAPQFRADKACESSDIPVQEAPDAGGEL